MLQALRMMPGVVYCPWIHRFNLPKPPLLLTWLNSLTSHIAELTGLRQTTEAVSLSLQALLEGLPLVPTTPPMPPADEEWFVSAPSSGLLAPAAAERFASASGLGLSAPCSKLPCPALPNVYDGDCKAGEHFLQSCITYIQLSGEAFTSDALKIAWVLSYMKAG
ncbi:hypothetical protein C0989_009363 [Termitomyces sp. Mn162]|nr:hypothetical protein C0989_009363 [Termitomyces sp. Mn162]